MLFRKNIIEKSFINWRILPLVKINTCISDTACIKVMQKHNYATFTKKSILKMKVII
jgi:hypothetical protein